MFGVWKVKGYWGTTIRNTPILFSDNDLLSDVKTGQLVYFDLEGNKASNIERASLSNFKVDFINNIIRCKDGESEFSFYSDNTFISFECLDNIIIPNEDKMKRSQIANDASSTSEAPKRKRERGKRVIGGGRILYDENYFDSNASFGFDSYKSPISNSTTNDSDKDESDGNDTIEDYFDEDDLFAGLGFHDSDDFGAFLFTDRFFSFLNSRLDLFDPFLVFCVACPHSFKLFAHTVSFTAAVHSSTDAAANRRN